MKNFLKKLAGISSQKNIDILKDKNQDSINDKSINSQDLQAIDKTEATNNKIKSQKNTLSKNQINEWPDDENNDYNDNYEEEGQLSVDVYQTSQSIIVQSTIAGVNPEDIDISVYNDMLTIKGRREAAKSIASNSYLYQECYWGSFSRSIILPEEINPNAVKAELENGILTVTLPKIKSQREIKVKIKD